MGIDFSSSNKLQNDSFTAHSLTAQRLDNGHIRLALKHSITASVEVRVFNPPEGTIFEKTGSVQAGDHQTLVCDLSEEELRKVEEVTFMLGRADDDRVAVFFRTSKLFEKLL